jgi:hypothetical protein
MMSADEAVIVVIVVLYYPGESSENQHFEWLSNDLNRLFARRSHRHRKSVGGRAILTKLLSAIVNIGRVVRSDPDPT